MSELKTAVFPIRCRGRNAAREKVLAEPVDVKVQVRGLENGETISIVVECPHNTGSHGQRCKASHPGKDIEVGKGVLCAYALDLPYAMDIAKF